MVPRTGEIDELDLNDDLEETVEIPGVAAQRADIEQTRADISETLDAIKDKLQPQVLIQQAKESAQEVTADVAEKAREVVQQARETVHTAVQEARETVHTVVQEAREAIPEAAHNAVSNVVDTAKEAVGGVVDSAKEKVGAAVDTAKDAGSTVVGIVRENPIPYALIGLGLGWLYMNARRSGSHASFVDRRYARTPAADYTVPNPGYVDTSTEDYTTWNRPYGTPAVNMLGTGGNTAEHSRVGETVRQVRDKIGNVAESVQEKGAQVVDQVQAKSEQVVDQAQQTWHQVSARTADQAREMAQGFQRTLEQNPLLIGAVALGIGAAIGFMMPETQPENRLMGETRDRLVENVQHKAHEVADKVQTVASETLDTAKEKVQNVASEVMDTAKSEAEKQGLTA